jgi:hypothetical protein
MWKYKISSFMEFLHVQAMRMQPVNTKVLILRLQCIWEIIQCNLFHIPLIIFHSYWEVIITEERLLNQGLIPFKLDSSLFCYTQYLDYIMSTFWDKFCELCFGSAFFVTCSIKIQNIHWRYFWHLRYLLDN